MLATLLYASADKAAAHELSAELRRNGMEVWVDWRSIAVGSDWVAEIRNAIRRADAVLILASRATAASQFLDAELAFAFASRERGETRRIIPVVLQRHSDLPAMLRGIQAFDWSDRGDVRPLVEAIREASHQTEEAPLKLTLPLVPSLLTTELELSLIVQQTLRQRLIVAGAVAMFAATILVVVLSASSTDQLWALLTPLTAALGAFVGFKYGQSSRDEGPENE